MHNLAIANNPMGNTYAELFQLDIDNALQTTLEFDELISIFITKIQKIIPHCGYVYKNTDLKLEYKSGFVTSHSCNFEFRLMNRYFGNLKIMSTKGYTQGEKQLFANFADCLLYPLQNASLFHQTKKMAYTDPLTKTGNRTAFNESLTREMSLAVRHSSPLSLIFLDIDHFKAINDQYGHERGDFTLTSVADWLKECIRTDDILFRYGGEEFVILLSDTGSRGAELLAERICAHIERHTLNFGVNQLKITASLGISTLRGKETKDSFLKRADAAMYQAKQNGRNQIRLAN